MGESCRRFAAVMIAETDLRGMRKMIAKHGSQMSSHLVELMTHPWTAEDLTAATWHARRWSTRWRG